MVKSAANRANEQAVQTARPSSKAATSRPGAGGGMDGFGDDSVCQCTFAKGISEEKLWTAESTPARQQYKHPIMDQMTSQQTDTTRRTLGTQKNANTEIRPLE